MENCSGVLKFKCDFIKILATLRKSSAQSTALGLLICTLISENQGLETSMFISNPRKIADSANLDFFFRCCTWNFAGLLYT